MAEAQQLIEARQVLTPQDIERMVTFLGSQEFRLSHREPGSAGLPDQVQPLRDDVQQFMDQWHALREVVEGILRQPSEALMPEVREVHVRDRYRMGLPALARNLREGRVVAGPEGDGWQPRGEYLWATTEVPTQDTPENAHVRAVVMAYEEMRTQLCSALLEEQTELLRRVQEKLGYGVDKAERLIRVLHRTADRAGREAEALATLPSIDLPASWDHLKSRAIRENNRTLFDTRYQQVAHLEELLDDLRTPGRPRDSREKIAQLGERRPWELYEYWMVAKTCALLEELQFEPDPPSGFTALEQWGGPAYGLREGASLVYSHPTAGLTVRLTVQDERVEGERPDLRLDLSAGIAGLHWPLILDAKCKAYDDHAGHPDLEGDLQQSARRYAGQAGGMAFLLHPATLRAWPAKGSEGHRFLQDGDFPFRHGVEHFRPTVEYGLQRILTAWFVRHGIFWVCFQCGEDLKDKKTDGHALSGASSLRVSKRHIGYKVGDSFPQFAAYCCPTCGMTGILSFCGDCARSKRGWRPIYKYVPFKARGNVRSVEGRGDWSKRFEIMALAPRRAHMRHCASCGATT